MHVAKNRRTCKAKITTSNKHKTIEILQRTHLNKPSRPTQRVKELKKYYSRPFVELVTN